ncbi:hypothetical protein MYCO108962_20715 [Mycobacterium colombiense]
MVASPNAGAIAVASPAAGAMAVSSPVKPIAGAMAVAPPAPSTAAGAAAIAAPRASAKVGSSATRTRMVDVSRSSSATRCRSGDAPSRYTSCGAPGWALRFAIMVWNAAVASPPDAPASGWEANTVGGASGSPSPAPTIDSVAVASSITSAAPGRPAARIRAATACDSESTATLCTPESSSARRSWSAAGWSVQHSRVPTSRWFSPASSRFVPTTVSVSVPIGLSARSTTDWSITSAPCAPDPTRANRATGPVTATPKTTSIPVLLHAGHPATSNVPASLHLRYRWQYRSFSDKLRLLAQRNQLFERQDASPRNRLRPSSRQQPLPRHPNGEYVRKRAVHFTRRGNPSPNTRSRTDNIRP